MKKRFLSFCLGTVMLTGLFSFPPTLNSDVPALASPYVVPPAASDTPVDAQFITTTGNGVTRHWGIVWSDEFNGTSLDTAKWDYQNGTGFSEFGFHGWGNEEVQSYRHQNVLVQNGHLTLRAQRVGNQWFSGKVRTTKDMMWNHSGKPSGTPNNNTQTFAQTYGRFEARIRLPAIQGMWPAFWMMPQNNVYGGWAASGEIDIMEAIGRLPEESTGAIHFGGPWPANTYLHGEYHFPSGGRIDQWNVYAVEWEANQIRWYVNGNLFRSINNNQWRTTFPGAGPGAPFDQDFHLILNLAVGGHFDGYLLPPNSAIGDMDIDWVRAYTRIDEIPDVPDPLNIALNKPAGASSFQNNQDGSYPPQNGNDGRSGTRWASGNTGPQNCNEWWMVDLEDVYNLERFALRWETAAADRYTIKTSTVHPGASPDPNSSIWTTVFNKNSGGQGEGLVEASFAAGTQGRWVMIHATRRAFSYGNTFYGPSFYNFALYGTKAQTVSNPGHISGNAYINSADITLLRRYIAHMGSGGTTQQFEAAHPNFRVANADVNGDGEINAADVTRLRLYVAATDPSTVPLGR
jgi:beta-glucanase (GH16 family)